MPNTAGAHQADSSDVKIATQRDRHPEVIRVSRLYARLKYRGSVLQQQTRTVRPQIKMDQPSIGAHQSSIVTSPRRIEIESDRLRCWPLANNMEYRIRQHRLR